MAGCYANKEDINDVDFVCYYKYNKLYSCFFCIINVFLCVCVQQFESFSFNLLYFCYPLKCSFKQTCR